MPLTQSRRGSGRWGFLILLLLVLLFSARWIASFFIELAWWKEVGQLDTWLAMLSYGFTPVVVAGVVCFGVFWLAHARGMKAAGTGLGEHPGYARMTTLLLIVIAFLVAFSTVDSWTVVRYAGGAGTDTGAWHDPVFGNNLAFYFFALPFYQLLLRYVLVLSLGTALVYWLTASGWRVHEQAQQYQGGDIGVVMPPELFNFQAALASSFLRGAAAIFLLAFAVSFFLDRYDLLLEQHGSLVGVDWVAEHLTLPLLAVEALASVLAAAAVWQRRLVLALILPATMLVAAIVPRIVYAAYVRPNEITIQKPYIQRHIQATRDAYGLNTRTKEVDFQVKPDAPIDLDKHRLLLDNVRLWDWRAFHDTITQIQGIRPYYVFAGSDVDRYTIDGQLRQMLLCARELDVRQLPADARSRWINPHFIYTHGYGLVMAEASRITRDGLPVLVMEDAPTVVKTDSLKLTRPEIYYGEATHEPVFVHSAHAEFDYPSASGNVETQYQGHGGFPISSIPMRIAASLSEGDFNILLTSYLQPDSRMMIRRRVRDRLETIAGFLAWDADPYLVVTQSGRLLWIADGYTTSAAHPYSRSVNLDTLGDLNYIRNSVKATVDAYDGTVRMYAFDTKDPILRAYRRLFPHLIVDASQMPPDVRAHTRYPETLFRVQAEIYRTFHMTNPEAFFNREDVWDLAKGMNGSEGGSADVRPTYLVATLPGTDEAEFLLMTTFTPHTKDNLIGLMVARCDGEHQGELLFLQLSKQDLVYGPLQMEARINQDQDISKDLTLWNQQGSQVLRGQMLVLPVENTLLYIEPIYIQASQARMPQLKKVALAIGNRLIYADTYEQALASLGGQPAETVAAPSGKKAAPVAAGQAAPLQAEVLQQVKEHLQKYRELLGKGQYAAAGKELESVEKLVGTVH